MPINVLIPTPLRPYTEGQEIVILKGKTVGELMQALVGQFPPLGHHLFDETGRLRSFVNLYLNKDDIRYREGLKTEVAEGDELRIIPSVAGGIHRELTMHRLKSLAP
jgi:sulfur-carrier protein